MKEFVVGSPYTTETTLDQSDEFLIVACDGVCPPAFPSPSPGPTFLTLSAPPPFRPLYLPGFPLSLVSPSFDP